MTYLFDPTPQPALTITGSEKVFPVRRIYCVGRNYAAHAAEMGPDSTKDEPCVVPTHPAAVPGAPGVPVPRAPPDLHPEVELVLALGQGGSDLDLDQAHAAIFGYGVGLDMTRRDLQQAAKLSGRPWEVGKSFENSAPMSALFPAEAIGHPRDKPIWLEVNGERRQDSVLSLLLWNPEEIICKLSQLFELAPGDLIMTGTPAGVGQVHRGDRLKACVEGVATLEITLT